MLQEKLKILEDIDEEVLGLCAVTEIEGEMEESSHVIARILNAIKKIERFVERLESKSNNQTSASSDDVNTSINNSENGSVNINERTNSGTVEAVVAGSEVEVESIGNISGVTSVNTNSTSTPNMVSKTKLPKLQLTKFKGQIGIGILSSRRYIPIKKFRRSTNLVI